jgi:predicted metal-binding membrane protein
MASQAHKSDTAATLVALVVGVSASAWIAMIALHEWLHGDHYSSYVASLPITVRDAISFCGTAPNASGAGFGNWIAGWALMTVAMMLPPALPLLRHFWRLTAGRRDASRLTGLLASTFLGVWLVAGLLLYSAGTLSNSALSAVPPLADRPWLLAGTAALLAGIYQFSDLKLACLDACRSPMSVIMTRWRSTYPAWSSVQIGLAYGIICVGCCWALMLLSVIAGAMALPIMVATGVLMMLERLLPSVRPLIPIQAGLAIIVGLLLMAGAIPPAFYIG